MVTQYQMGCHLKEEIDFVCVVPELEITGRQFSALYKEEHL